MTDDYVIVCCLFWTHISAAEVVPPGVWQYEADHLGEPDEDAEEDDKQTPSETNTELLMVPVSCGDVWHC